MPSENYSFLDVAVLDEVRSRFAAGDALTILSTDLEQVIWANGPGAALFGYPGIDAVIGSSSRLPPVARRQIAATSGYPAIGRDRSILVRLASGMTSQAVGFLASAIAMPDGEPAILLSVPAAQTASRGPDEIARRAISGFAEDGQFLAMIDANGKVEAASDGFAALGIGSDTLAALVKDVAGESDRIVKRLLPAGDVSLPSGIARLTDDPARHLLVVIDEQEEAPQASDDESEPEQATETAIAAPSTGTPTEAEASPEPEAAGSGAVANETTAATPEADVPVEPAPAATAEEPNVAAEEPAVPEPTIDRNAAPVRFVWRTDADGRFSALSPEFAGAMGAAASDIVGRSFKDVATSAGFDQNGEIAGLLERRDTWSGRSVLWPGAGGLKIPVDLAALPVYSRSRAFEGFRGFGVARLADAVIDTTPAPAVPVEKADVASGAEAVPTEPGEPAGEDPTASTGEQSASPEKSEEAPVTGEAAPATGAKDPFKGEVPALTIVPKPERRFSDKVIRLAEHRQSTNDKGSNDKSPDKGLSLIERSAFREIGERLKKDVPPASEPSVSAPADKPEAVSAAAGPASSQPTDDRAAKPETETAQVVAADMAEKLPTATSAEAKAPGETEAADDSRTLEAIADSEETGDLERLDGVGDATDETTPGPQSTASPARRSGSLLDFADRAESTTKEPETPAEPVSSDNGEAADPAASAEADADDDSIAEADFKDARDDETLPITATVEEAAETAVSDASAVESTASHHVEPAAAAADAQAGSAPTGRDKTAEPGAPRPAPLAPSIRTEGVVPAAFALGVGQTPDTSLLARLPVPVLIHSGDQLHYANEEFLSLTGYASLTELDAAGGLDALFVDPYADDSASDGTDRALKLRTSDGEHIPVDAILRSVPWRDGKALMLVIRRTGEDEREPAAPLAGEPTQPDISELKARIAEMRTIIDTATDGVVLIGRDGMIRSISRPAEALFGFDGDEVAGKPFASLFAIESQRAARDYLAGLSEPGVASVLNDGREVIGREAQGRFIPLFMTIGRLPNDSGFCAVVRDITQWKRAEEDLTQARAVAERASSQKTDFLARISHEIRTPLNAIIGFSELMVDEKFGPVANERYRDYLRDINRSGNHVLDLVNDLLDISKIEAGQQEMDYQAVSLNDTLAEAVAMMQPQANRERVIIRSSFASRLPEVVADLRSMRQIALNVLSNAIRYTQAGGQVIVSTAYEASGDVAMRVRDTGVGMTAAEIEQALKPFKQINALKRGRGDGTGLGLPLTKAMVEANRARFTLTSTPGEGTLVEVAFPSTRVLAE